MEDKTKIRLGQTLVFDTKQEKDIIANIDRLRESNKLASMLSHLIRLAFESPEKFNDMDNAASVIQKMYELGISPTRYKYFENISKEVVELRKRIDQIYNMAYEMYILAKAGKRMGLEERSDNMLIATFLLERQTDNICSLFGIDKLEYCHLSNKLRDTHNKADEILEYILESYDGIINELYSSVHSNINYSESKYSSDVKGYMGTSTEQYDKDKGNTDNINKVEPVKHVDDTLDDLFEDEEDTILMTENRKDNLIIKPLDEDRAAAFLDMID